MPNQHLKGKHDVDIKSLLDQPGKLPNIPKVAHHLIESFSADNISIAEIADQLAADPALSAKLLRLANSAYFHVSRTVGTVDDALRMLGFVMVRNLVLGNGMVAAFRNTPGLNLTQFWRYNLYAASASRWLANASGANTDLVFTVGLMHAIGQLQMHAVAPDEMAPLDRQCHVLDGARADLERQNFGFHHGDVAAELARIWHFPADIVAALRATPHPLDAQEFSEAAAWVHLGAWRARAEVLEYSDDQISTSYPQAVGKRLGVSPAWVPIMATAYPGSSTVIMPALAELTEGLDAMLA
jgi:HD-like signal output (HDOD) protein